MTTYDKLHVCRLTHSQYLGTCGYWFTVQNRCTALTAFATLAGLLHWAQQRGLTIPLDLPREGRHDDLADNRHAYTGIIGAYRTAMLWDETAFDEMACLLETRTLSNGHWVVAKITKDADGLRTVYTLNPNVHTRHTYDHAESRALMS